MTRSEQEGQDDDDRRSKSPSDEWEQVQHDEGQEDDEDSQDDDDDDEDEEETSWTKEFMDGWKQHSVAVFVAILATAIYHQKVLQPSAVDPASVLHPTAMHAPTTYLLDDYKHRHLYDYQRTANISFCGDMMLDMLDIAGGNNNNNLQLFDFHVDKDECNIMSIHFAADAMGDDDYSSVLGLANREIRKKAQDSRQQECLRNQFLHAQQSFVKGMTFYYQSPSIESMYLGDDTPRIGPSIMKKNKVEAVHLSFTGFAAKFYNLSPKPILLHWDGRGGEGARLVGEIAPFESLGTATTPGQSFSVSPVYDTSHALDRWVVTADEAILYYDPLAKYDEAAMGRLGLEAQQRYRMQLLNKEFAKHYLIHSGRSWLAHFPRPFPVHPFWEASYFGQVHTIQTPTGQEYELTVQSVTPRVFTIDNFMSEAECDALIDRALGKGMEPSTVYSGTTAKHQRDLSTRSSTNTWIPRETASLTDSLYRRAGHILQLDESLLQAPIHDDVHAHQHNIAESLQVIRYKEGEEYTPHHDFVYPSQTHRHQPTRFATLLIYLNDDFEGGHTVFPRAVNKEFHDGIRIQPQKGRAVLFYNMLPDGNVDDLSQHSSEVVVEGNKFAANLWIWEPVIN